MTPTPDRNGDLLAAEYALGVLDGREAVDAAARFVSDPEFRAAVEAWQLRLAPMLEDAPALAVRDRVWREIAGATFGADAEAAGGIWSNLRFWRGFGLACAALSALLIATAVVLNLSGRVAWQEGGQPLFASLTATGETPVFLASFDPVSGALIVRADLREVEALLYPELWIIAGDGVPRSLGILDRTGTMDVAVNADLRQGFGAGATLAVSLEPEGGSPTGAPTGPVIASGELQTF